MHLVLLLVAMVDEQVVRVQMVRVVVGAILHCVLVVVLVDESLHL